MNTFNKKTVKLVALAQILALLFSACTSMGTTLGATNSSTVCHATGDPTSPYEALTVTKTELKEHLQHPNDINPVPVNGCPTSELTVIDGKVSICHATGSETNPYKEISISVNGLNGHGKHEGDLIPVPEGGCPASPVVSGDALTVCHATGDLANPYEALTVTSAEFDEHLQHPNDINPVPVNGCPTSEEVAVIDGEISFCHATGDETNPYDRITVSADGLDGHGTHAGDVFPTSEGDCLANPVSDGKITICHVTGSETNPYNEITVDVNGLNGHDKHEGDIIPVPAGGCPTTKP